MTTQSLFWILFWILVPAVLYMDLFVLNKRSHALGFREAAGWWLTWVALAVCFGLGIYFRLGHEKGLQFFAGYLIEQSLSVDNMFVFLMLFGYFAVPSDLQPRVLKWGILGAVGMRFIFIFVGTVLVRTFHWVLYLFGAFLVYTAYKMAFGPEKELEPEKSALFRLVRKFLPLTGYQDGRFFTKVNGVWHGTTLMLALVMVEFSDVVFALDSIPAVFAVTTDTFLVYTSNIFAILGLRALYFLLSGLVKLFSYLKYGVAVILAFVGVKMMVMDLYHVSTGASLSVIVVTLAASVLASMVFKPKPAEPPVHLEGPKSGF